MSIQSGSPRSYFTFEILLKPRAFFDLVENFNGYIMVI